MTKQEKNTTQSPNDHDVTSETPEEMQTESHGKETDEHKKQQKQLQEQEKRLNELENELKVAKKNESEALLRARAEIENNRRRMAQDVEKANKFALEKFSNELLPILDNLERALEATDKNNPHLKGTIEGLELTLRTFLDTVKKFGIEQINPKNEVLNPELHQAISVVESPDHKSGQIINAIQKGYMLNGRLLRPAMVIVAK